MADDRLRLAELLSAAVDGELTVDERETVERLLATDAAAAREHATLLALKAAVRRAAGVQPLPDLVLSRVRRGLDAIDAEMAPDLEPAPVRRLGWLHPAALFAAAAVVVLGVALPGRHRTRAVAPTVAATTTQARWDLAPANLVMTHRAWHKAFAGQIPPAQTPDEMARRLADKVGYEVSPPQAGRLQATLVGCAVCDHTVPGHLTAVFVMERAEHEALSLFQVVAPPAELDTRGFREHCPGVQVAEYDGVHLALWSQGDRHVVLAADRASCGELARLIPAAVRLAASPPLQRYARLPL